jgi:hypothetical protein
MKLSCTLYAAIWMSGDGDEQRRRGGAREGDNVKAHDPEVWVVWPLLPGIVITFRAASIRCHRSPEGSVTSGVYDKSSRCISAVFALKLLPSVSIAPSSTFITVDCRGSFVRCRRFR